MSAREVRGQTRSFTRSIQIKGRTDLGGVLVAVLGEDERWDGVDEIEAPDEDEAEDEGPGGAAGAVEGDDGRSDPAQCLEVKRAEKERRPNVGGANPNPDAHHNVTHISTEENLRGKYRNTQC